MQTDDGTDPVNIFTLLADDYARDILIAANKRPMSAKALSDACSASLPTIYRRVSTLKEEGLLVERTIIDQEGTHKSVFQTQLNELHIELDEENFSVVINTRNDLADRFSALWDEMRE